MTSTDTSIIDAELKNVIALAKTPKINRAVIIRNIICENGVSPAVGRGGFDGFTVDSLLFKGYTVVRNCHSKGNGGAFYRAYLYDHAKITNNLADSFGGAGCDIYAYDSAEICHNTAAYGGAVGYFSGGTITCNSPGVRIHHNTATIAGGAIYGMPNMTAGQITDNQAPIGAALHTLTCGAALLQNMKIYNPRPDGTRQNEVYVRSGFFNMEGSWFGKSDTIGLIKVGPTPCDPANAVKGRYAKANWSVNWGKALSKNDTLFPIGAGFTYSDGSLLPAKSCPWLVGNFTSSTGSFVTAKPVMQPNDTLSSLFRSYVYATKGDTSSKFISYVCSIDADTFRANPRVWGIDSISLSIQGIAETLQIKIYPNPTTEYLYIQGAAIGSTIALYDVQGRIVKSEELKNNNSQIDVRLLPKGNYLLKITTKEGEEGSAMVVKE
ncbi:MAG: T9SS type A sorting domain-containing protein [Chitinophagaceae bacterium]|nr:T9SS type A sorting domain-containing protein [Chitinophagaceae bacterium]